MNGALHLPQQAALTERLPTVGERDDDAVARPHEAGQLVLRLGEAAGGHGRALRLELMRLAPGKGIEFRRTLQRDR